MPGHTISLIIPAHNEEKYIGDCLDHAIKNSGGRFCEIIVVDNASTDGTKETALKRPSVRVVGEKEKGPTKARERGFKEATGDILAYIDADTLMPVGWVDTVIEEFSKNPGLAILSGPYIYHDIPFRNRVWVKLYWLFIGIPTYWVTRCMVVGGNFAIKKSVLEKMSGFDTSIAFYGDDTNIARRAKAFGKVKFTLGLPMYTSGRRINKEGLSKTGFIYVINYISEIILKKPLTKKYVDIR